MKKDITKIIIYIFILSSIIIYSNEMFSQSGGTVNGPTSSCAGEVVEYYITNNGYNYSYYFSGDYLSKSEEILANGDTKLSIVWNRGFTEAEFFIIAWCNVANLDYSCEDYFYFDEKRVDSIQIDAAPVKSTINANETISFTGVFNGLYTGQFSEAGIKWSVRDAGSDAELFSLGTGKTVSFTPDDHKSELAAYFNEKKVVIKAEFANCSSIAYGYFELTINKTPPTFAVTPSPQKCYGKTDGSISVSNIVYDLDPTIETFEISVTPYYFDPVLGKNVPSENAIQTIQTTNKTHTFSNIGPSSLINSGYLGYFVKVEVLINSLHFALSNSIETNITAATQITPSSSVSSSITCNGGTGAITTTASGGNGTLSFSSDQTNWYDASSISSNVYSYVKSGLASSNYTFYVRDLNLCTVSAPEVMLDPVAAISHTATPNSPVNCTPEQGSIHVSATNVNTFAEFTLSKTGMTTITVRDNDETDGGWSNLFEGLEPGTYSIKVKHACELDSSIANDLIINSLDKPSVSNTDVLVDSASCYKGEGTIIITKFSHGPSDYYSNSSGLDNFSFAFNENSISSSEFFNHIGTGGNTDTLKITDNLGCTGSVIQYIGHPQQITLTTIDSVPSCRDYNNGSITFGSTQGSSESGAERKFILKDSLGNELETITDNSFPYGATFPDYPSGGYWVTVSDGCIVNGSTEVEVSIANYPAIEVDIDTFDISCNNDNDGKIRVTPTAGDENFTISFTDITTYTGRTTNHTDSVINLLSGDYEVLVTDGNGCTNTYNGITITNPPPLQITSEDSNITPVTCWDGNDGTIVVNATGGTGDIYFAVYDDGDNLLDSTFYAPDYSNVFETLKAGTKTIKVTDINKCFVEKDFVILQPDEYKITNLFTDSTKCYGGSDGSLSVTATGGTPNGLDYTYNLMDESNNIVDSISGITATFTGHPFGNYYVNIYDSSSCLLTSSTIELSQPEEMKITKHMSAVSCYSTTDITLSASILGGTAPYSYIWKDENENIYSSDSSIKVNEGNYFLNVVDANKCGYGKTIPGMESFPLHYAVEKPDTLKLFINNLQNVDYFGLSNGSVVLSWSGGWESSTHQYSMNGINYQNPPEFSGLGIGTYTFYVKDGGNCENSVTTTITQPDPFLVSLKSTKDVNCFEGSDGQISIHAEGGLSPYNFVLDDGNGNTITQNDSVFLNLPIGTYSVTVGYNTYSQLVNNIAIGQPSSALSSDITAYQSPKCNFSDGWATVTASGGTSPYSYSWTNEQTSATATALHSGNYYVVTSDFNNCLDTSSIMLYDIAGPELSIIQINGLPCYDSDNVGSITLDVSGGTGPYTIQWNDPNQQTGLTATGLATGSYSATVTDFDGCISKSKDTLITRPSELIISFDAFKDPSCNNDSDGEIIASGSGGTPPYQFEWPEINNAGNTGIVSGLASGVYQLNLNDDHSCITTGSFELKNPDPIIINLNDSIFICAGQTATLDAGNPGSFYQWTSTTGFSSDKQVVNLQEQGDYTLSISNVQGCSNSKKVHLKFENRQFDAGFLLASQATMTDTIVLIEISWPVPDSLEWFIADDFLRLVDGDAYKELIPLETGEYTFGMKAYLAGCEDIVEKTITILPADGQKYLKNEITDLIQSAKLFPNPNSGNFEVEINLAHENEVRADLFSMNGLRIIPTKYDSGKKDYLIDFNLMRLEPGVYFVNVAAGNEVRKLKFVVN